MSAELAWALTAIFFLLLLAAFFSAAETALTAASKSRMHALARDGNKRAAAVNAIREHKDKMIGALLLGNNLVNTLGSALATSFLISMFGEAGIFYATAVMTALILIFAEVLPKTYALHYADNMAMRVAPPVRLVIKVFTPVTALVAWIVRLILKLFGADISVVNVGSHVEMLRGAIELHSGREEETQVQRAMLRSILDLAEVEVGEVMTHRKNVEMIDAGQPISVIMEQLLRSPYTRIPIWVEEQDNIVGILHVKSVLKEMQAKGGRITNLDIRAVAAEPWFVPDTTSLAEQLQAFRKRREHFALVVDEYGTYMGVVTLEDVLEEIVGDIDDEMDEIVAGVRKQPNGSYIIDGAVTIRDLNRDFNWDLPDDEDYSTIAGLILHESQMVPETGRVFHFFDFRFEVLRRQRNQITLVRVTPPRKAVKKASAT